MNKCGCKDNKWGNHGDNLGEIVESDGELWHFRNDLIRFEGNCQIVKRLNE
jgi:hypothetical protein